MAKTVETRTETIKQLWSQLDKGRVCMLGITGTDQHPQPMTLFADEDAGAVWFITSADTDLAQATTPAAAAQMVFMSDKQDYQTSLKGTLEIVQSDEKLDDLWNVAAAAWFEHGRKDPAVRLMRFTPAEAAIWASQSNAVLVGIKMLNAGLRDGEDHPDIGTHHVVDLRAAV